jgi:tetratricopeptide (TPR) repeat protein
MSRPTDAIEELETYLRLSGGAQLAARRVLEHESSPAFALALKGDCLLTLGQKAEAEAAFREAIRRQPDAPEGHLGMGRIQGLRGEYDEAVRSFEKARALFKDLPRAHLALAEAHMARRGWAEALESLETFLGIEPRDPRALSLRAEALLHAGRRDEAEAAYRHLLTVDDNPEARLALACLAEARGLGDEVLSHCQAAIRLGGEDARIFFVQGKQWMARRDWIQAEQSLLEALRRAPETLEIYESLAAVAMAKGDLAQALSYFQDLAARAPGHPLAAKAIPLLRASFAAA